MRRRKRFGLPSRPIAPDLGRCLSWRALAALAASLGLTGCGSSFEALQPVTDRGDDINRLFNLAMLLSAVIFLLVMGLLIWVLIRFRGRPGDPDPEQVSGNTRLEVFWTAVPVLLLTGLFVLTLQTMGRVEQDEPNALRVDVIGHTWWWEFRYPDLNIETANELHLPADRPVIFHLTSDDVIHSFWVPQFGWKIDAVPGKSNYMRLTPQEPGRFDGACAEYCGTQHAWMRFVAFVDEPAEFDGWVRERQQTPAPPSAGQIAQGQDIFLRNTCVNCHTIAGTVANGGVGPELTHVGSRTTLGAGVIGNTPENMARFIRDPHAIKPGVLMPGFNFSDDELAALVAYLEGLK